jgi:hypothetical protein
MFHHIFNENTTIVLPTTYAKSDISRYFSTGFPLLYISILYLASFFWCWCTNIFAASTPFLLDFRNTPQLRRTMIPRDEYRAKKELEEARKSGALPPEKDAAGNLINPHIPEFMSKAPWYLGGANVRDEGVLNASRDARCTIN